MPLSTPICPASPSTAIVTVPEGFSVTLTLACALAATMMATNKSKIFRIVIVDMIYTLFVLYTE